MPSERKSETARRNGAKSHGPVTAAGLQNSSQNSLKHGFTARSMVLLACEDPSEFEQILREYRAMYRPSTAAEQDLVDEMVAARWRIRRLWTIETCLLDAEMQRGQPPLDAGASPEHSPERTPEHSVDPSIYLARAFRGLADNSRSLALTSRYEARLHRIHDRAFETLRALQQARGEVENTNRNPEDGPSSETVRT
jgi:hypothetical protein